MQNIAVVFGGVSCEHDISIVSALLVLENINKQKYNVFPIYIGGTGEWFLCEGNLTALDFKRRKMPDRAFKTITFLPGDNNLYFLKSKKLKKIDKIDCAVLVNHGLNGEDGTISSLMQLCNIPCSLSNIFSAAASMDKVAAKLIFKALDLNVLPYIDFSLNDYREEKEKILDDIKKLLDFPVIVKPCNLGSSIGISVCGNIEELNFAIEAAFKYDVKIVVEKAVKDFIELNCSALHTNNEIMASEVERPISYKEFLNFDEKYGVKIGMENCKRELPAKIDGELRTKIQEITKTIYKNFDCTGVVRVDYIYKDKIYINEVNAIPGSLSYYLWESENISFSKLIDILILEAIKKFDEFKNCSFSYNSDILKITPKK